MSAKNTDLYANKVVLAPMVRAGRTPLRCLALSYGAGLVYTEEIVDQKLLASSRVKNDCLKTVDYVLDDELVLRVADEERHQCILQVGSNSEQGCILASKKIGHDVAGIDVNMGCPKPFSISGGMGAALLSKPDLMISSLVSVSTIPVSCKIRMLDSLPSTIEFAQLLEKCGVSALAIHGRRRSERPVHENRSQEVREVARSLNIPVIPSGESSNVQSHADLAAVMEKIGTDSIMIARKALSHPSIFKEEGMLDMDTEIHNFLRQACLYDEPYTTTKYMVQRILGSQQEFDPRGKQTLGCLTVREICQVWDQGHFFNECVETRKRLMCKRHSESAEFAEDGVQMGDWSFPPKRLKANHGTLSPKCVLLRYCDEQKMDRPTFQTKKRKRDGRYEGIVHVADLRFGSRISQPNIKMAEQVACLAALHGLNIRYKLPGQWEQ